MSLFSEVGTCHSSLRANVWYSYGIRISLTTTPSVMDELDYLDQTGRKTYGQLRTALAEKFPGLGFGQNPSLLATFRVWLSKMTGKVLELG